MLLIIFGLPGSGKNYVGDILKKDFDFSFHDIDNDIPSDLKKRIAQGEVLSENTRTKFFNRAIQKIKKLYNKNDRLAVSQALIKEKHRKLIMKNFPEAKFILVKANSKIINSRLDFRKHLITKNYAKKLKKIFEEPKIPHYIIENNSDGKEKIKAKLQKFLNGI